MTETANTSPSRAIQKNGEPKKNGCTPEELYKQYSMERESLTVKEKKRKASNNRRARLRDLDERLIPNVIRRLNERD